MSLSDLWKWNLDYNSSDFLCDGNLSVVFLCVSFWGEPLWFAFFLVGLLFVGPCLLFVCCMCVNQYLHWLVEMSLVNNGAECDDTRYPSLLCWDSPVVKRCLGFSLCNDWEAPFSVLGNCDPARPFCIAFVWLIFDNACCDNQSSFHLIGPLECILQNWEIFSMLLERERK